MKLYIHNTLSRTEEEFIPRNGKKVDMFVCGQTVYDDAHLGHAKTYINFDVVVRWLRYLGYEVKYIQNVTDIDDKIIARAKERNMDPLELARSYEKRLMEDMESIGVKQNVSKYERSYDFLDSIREQIQLLLDNGYAYALEGDVYYDVAKFKDYTKLSGMSLDELVNHRIESKEGKKNVYDFALWKASKEGEPSWTIKLRLNGKESDFAGRPGWHIEDTAITAKVFGPQYDLHGGALELLFPHHSNEIAQAEAAFGVKPFVKYWMHSGVLNIKGEKMSKSLKNFITIREALKKYDPEVIRLMVSSTHYRKEINYTENLMQTAKNNLQYMYASLSRFYNMKTGEPAKDDELVIDMIEEFDDKFSNAMNDDFNTALALTNLMITTRELRSFAESHSIIGAETKEKAIKKVLELSSKVGILQKETYKDKIPDEIYSMIQERETFRKAKDFAKADAIRSKLKEEHRIELEDTEYGPVWYKN